MEIRVIASSSAGNSTFINDGESSLLLDAGINMERLLRGTGFRLSTVAGCLITHEHKDHSCAAGQIARRGVNIHTSYGTLDALKLSGHRYRVVKPLEVVQVGTFDILPFDVLHDAKEPLGFLVESRVTGEKLVYFSDTAYVKYKFTGVTHFIAECNHGGQELRRSVRDGVVNTELAKRIAKNHFSLERLIDFLNANDLSRLKQIYLIHLSANNSDISRFKQSIQRITGAEVYVN